MKLPQLIVMLTGAALIIAGVVIIVLNPIPATSAGGTIDIALRDATVRTNHIGFALAFVGAVLEIVGFVGPKLSSGFWK